MPPNPPKQFTLLTTGFKGEGNPVETKAVEQALQADVVTITPDERTVLKKLLERDRTSRIVHGGLKSLLTFSDDEISTLLGFLDRI